MKSQRNIAGFAINTNLDALQDIYDIEDAVDDIVGALMESEEVPTDVWMGLTLLRERLDVLKARSMLIPMIIREECPDHHAPEPADNT